MGHQVAVHVVPDGALVGMVTDLLNNGGAIYTRWVRPTSAMEEVLMARIGLHMGLPEGCGLGVMCHMGGRLANLVALRCGGSPCRMEVASRSTRSTTRGRIWEMTVRELCGVSNRRTTETGPGGPIIMGWGAEGGAIGSDG